MTAGTAIASKAILLDAQKDVSGINDVTCEGSLQAADVLIGTSEWKVVFSGSDLLFQKWNGVDTWLTKSVISGA